MLLEATRRILTSYQTGEETFVTGSSSHASIQPECLQTVITQLTDPLPSITSMKEGIMADAKAKMYELVIIEDIFPGQTCMNQFTRDSLSGVLDTLSVSKSLERIS